MNLNSPLEILPLIRIKPFILSISKDLPFQALQYKINIQLKHNLKITHLNISHNNIQQVPKIPENITHLYVNGCKLANIDLRKGYEQLLILDLSFNNLWRIPKIDSKKLKRLNLNDNEIDIIEDHIGQYALQQLKIQRNNISHIFVQFLKMPIVIEYQLLNLLNPHNPKLQNIGKYATLTQIIQKYTYQMQPPQLHQIFINAVQLNYHIFIHTFYHKVKPFINLHTTLYQTYHHKYYKSLQALLQISHYTQGFQKFRIQSLNGYIMNLQCIDIQLILSLIQKQPRYRQKRCQKLIQYLNENKVCLIKEENLMGIFKCRNRNIIQLIIDLQKDSLNQCNFSEQVIKAIFDLDSISIVNLMLQVQNFRKQIVKNLRRKYNPIRYINPNSNIYKIIYKYIKIYIKQHLNRNILKFTEYQKIPNTQRYYSLSKHFPKLNTSKLSTQYQQLNKWQLNCGVINKQKIQQYDYNKQNGYITIMERVDHELKSKNYLRKSMTAIAILKHMNDHI